MSDWKPGPPPAEPRSTRLAHIRTKATENAGRLLLAAALTVGLVVGYTAGQSSGDFDAARATEVARKAGYKAGHEAGFKAGRDAGWEAGYLDGRKEYQAQWTARKARDVCMAQAELRVRQARVEDGAYELAASSGLGVAGSPEYRSCDESQKIAVADVRSRVEEVRSEARKLDKVSREREE